MNGKDKYVRRVEVDLTEWKKEADKLAKKARPKYIRLIDDLLGPIFKKGIP